MSVGFHELRLAHQWSTTDKDSSFTVSGGGLILTGGGAGSGSFVSARCNRRMIANQKIYFETTLNAFANGIAIGIANPSASLSSYVGSDTNGVTAYFSSPGSAGEWSYNGGQTGTLGSPATGAVIGIAINCASGLIWLRVGASGNWNNAAIGSQNPATNTGGFSCTGIFTTNSIMIAASSNDTGAQQTINCGPTFAGTVPAGFRAPNSMVNAK